MVVTDTLPAELVLVAGSATLDGFATGVSEAPPLITADYSTSYGPLAPGASTVLRFRANIGAAVPIGTVVTNVAQVSWNDPPQTANASVSLVVGGTPGVAAISGALWHDADFDAVQGAGETALAGWNVELVVNGQPAVSVQSDAAGAWRMSGLAPNDASGDVYALRFSAPDATPTSAALGETDSPYTDGLQEITDILLVSGSDVADLNLPLAPTAWSTTRSGGPRSPAPSSRSWTRRGAWCPPPASTTPISRIR